MASSTEITEERRLSPGTVLGRYFVEKELGAGGMGTVYRAVHVDLGKRVAIKVLHPWIAAEPQTRERFLLEGKAAARVRHPNVVDVYDVVEGDGLTYLVMEFLEGRGLHEVLEIRGYLSPSDIAEVLVPIAVALDATHRKGIVHRDVKPSNIFLAENEQGEIAPKLLDFGVSKIDEEVTDIGGGMVLGTPFYMSPEQASGCPNIDARSDQYSLGVIAYQCVTGRLPFEAESLYKVLHKVLEADYEIPTRLDPKIDPKFQDFIRTAMSRCADERFPTMVEFGRELLSWGSEPLRSTWTSVLGTVARHRAQAGGVMLLPPPRWASQAESQDSHHAKITAPPVQSLQKVASWISERSRRKGNTRSRSIRPNHFGQTLRKVPMRSRAMLSLAAVGAMLFFLTVNGYGSASEAAVADTGVATRRTLHVQVQTKPAKATLELDGRVVGIGILEMDFPLDGKVHSLRARAPGYQSVLVLFREVPPPAQLTLEALVP